MRVGTTEVLRWLKTLRALVHSVLSAGQWFRGCGVLTNSYDTGVADDSLFTYHLVNFDVGLGYPEQAKILLAIVVLVPLGLVALVWFIVRRVRRRRGGQSA